MSPNKPRVVSKYELTEDSFNNLLEWLGGSEVSGDKYEEIRRKLINFLTWKGCPNPDELTDKAINIVASKLPELAEDYEGDPTRYFLAVARNLVHRSNPINLQDELSPNLTAPEIDPFEEIPLEDIDEKCHQDCLRGLPEKDRKLIIVYCQKGGQHDEDFRRALAEELKMKPGTLRVKISRIREKLNNCFKKCKKKS